MKIKLLVLLTGTFLAVAYLIGCGGGGNNGTNTSCPAGQTWNGATCVVGYGANSLQACQAQFAPGTPQYQQCIASSGCGTGVAGAYGQPYGQQPYGYGGATAGYPQQNCGATGVAPYGQPYGQPYGYGGNYGYGYQSGYSGYGPYPPQGGYYYYPPQQSGINFGMSFH